MASLRDIRKRIRSFKASQKITRAMQMVAASKLRRAQDALAGSEPFAMATRAQLDRLRAAAAELPPEQLPPLMRAPAASQADGAAAEATWVVLGSDRGLCGAFNAQLFRAVERRWRPRLVAEEAAGRQADAQVVPWGRKAREHYTRRAHTRTLFADLSPGTKDFARVVAAAQNLLAHASAQPEGAVWVAYNRFQSVISQVPTLERLWPLEAEPVALAAAAGGPSPLRPPISEPSFAAVADELVPRQVAVGLWRALLHSAASEYGSRMTAMDAATRNAGDLIEELTLQYNRARQSAITRDLMDIVGGAEALSQ